MYCLETVISLLRGGIWSSFVRFLQGFAQNKLPLLGVSKLTSSTVVTPTLAANEAPTRSLTGSTMSYDILFKPKYSLPVRYPSYRLPISILLISGTMSLLILAAKRKSSGGIGIEPRRMKIKNRSKILVNKMNYDLLEEKPYNFFNPGKSSRINSSSGYCWNVGPKISSCQADIEETSDTKLDCTINQYCHSVDYNNHEPPKSLILELQMKNISVKEYLELLLEESEDEEDGPEVAYTQCIHMSKSNKLELELKVRSEIDSICLNSDEAKVYQVSKTLRTLMSYEPVDALKDNNNISMSETYLKELKAALPRILQAGTSNASYKIPIVLLLRDYFLYSENRETEVRQFKDCILYFFEFIKLCDSPNDNKLASKALLQVLIAIEEDMFNVTIPIICKSLNTEKHENNQCFVPILKSLKIALAISEKAKSRILALKSIRTIIRKVIHTSQSLDTEFLSELNEVFWVCQNVDYYVDEAKSRSILSDINEALEYIESKTSDREKENSTSNET
ncbi:hypothetical protein CLIB1423_12S00562 [[Candida] railenensis]|uniref:Uncharacterized protein n=1 Tax=[Candida] railenensis TaxID=45579 RepID=A0A9P0VZK2_9ASCO|nr:hypothetical protein CLIB1423_12S00562 [[Candida] railenensis]